MAEGPHTQSIQNAEQAKERLIQAYEIYNGLVDGKVTDFEEVKDYLVEILERLLAQGKIGEGVILSARIKSPASVVENWKLGKDLNDIFGITLLTTTKEEMEAIELALREERRFDTSSKKKMSKKRGYEAIHFTFDVGDKEDQKTKVECHMQTHDDYTNVYTHIFYKITRKLNRDLTPEEERQIEEKVQQMFESGELSGYQLSGGKKSRLPEMWVIGFNQHGKMEEQKLDETMTLKIMYPFLDISKKKPGVPTSKVTNTQPEEQEVEI